MKKLSVNDLKNYSYFSSLSDGALEVLSRKIKQVEFPVGTKIIKEGEQGKSLYFVCKGEVDVTKKTEFGQDAKLSSSGAGESFGEMALITNLPRSSTVTAKTDVMLSEISREDFEEIISLDTSFSNLLGRQSQNYAEFISLKTLQPFALIEPEKMLTLIDKMKGKKYSPGEVIITQGDKGSEYYIIRSGRVEVIQKKGDNPPEQVAELGSGLGFGEEAIIREMPRNATVQAIDETTVLVLDKATFDGILRKSFVENAFPEEIPEEERSKVVFIDARITPEYEEEHIAGAINIPIEILRQKFGELDKAKTYYTYCTNDSRGMTAAFLMKSMGYNASALRGGLSAWDGPTERTGDGIHQPATVN
ncbi:MAG: hypothetical protein C4538_10485 [Nitrospiraceae bacterium]|nr:MAG: hypothetical protein C4538_10485 [Nitrospiraceae bacterium]